MQTTQSPRIAWPRVVLWLSLAGLIAAIAWGLYAYEGLQSRLSDFPRTAVPGELSVEVSQPQTLTIFYEDPIADRTFVVRSSDTNTLNAPPLELGVTGPSGDPIQTTRYERDLRFDHGGRVLTAMATFDADEAGTFTIEAAGNVPAEARASVGEVVEFELVANVLGVVGLFIGSLLGMTIALVFIGLKRGRTPSIEAERPLVRV